ncbi:MAG: acetyl-coenzyme A synthetase, partial [Candidatus Diapherotrites archaeon]|nr:acetyl-coenzyme A synthetase [Candidatus Diapherotrites archaeon]
MDGAKLVAADSKKRHVFWPSPEMKKQAWISTPKIYSMAGKNPKAFWAGLAKEGLSWEKPWKKLYESKPPYFKWFLGGKLNASYNCLDRHLKDRGNKVAIIWEPEPLNER